MIKIDGSHGEGGGQILRTSLALAMCTQQPVHIVNIRAKRRKPGLMRQHLTAVQAAGQVCSAEIEGDRIGSTELRFQPGLPEAGQYTFSVGTAGSTNLVFQTVLPGLLSAGAHSQLTLEGGTHNPMAPPFDFIEQTFLPLLQRMGANVEVHLQRPGFYPAGGGMWTVKIQPIKKLKPLYLHERGELLEHKAIAVCAGLPGHIARRELETVAKMLHWDDACLHSRQLPRHQGPGNYLSIVLRSEQVTVVFSGFGQRGITAENVAKACVKRVQRYLSLGVVADEHLTDQLLLPLALAGGGEFTGVTPSRHTTTNIEIIQRFLPVRFASKRIAEDVYRFTCF